MPSAQQPTRKSLPERFLGLFADVRPGEGLTVVLLAINVFLLLLAYYLIKTVREPLILTGGGAEVKAYAAAGQSFLLIFVVKGFAKIAEKFDRVRLISAVSLFFVSNLLLFYVLVRVDVPFIGVAFFLWVGIFSVTIIAQFWSFANDVYTEEQGNRLFAVVGIGSSVGAVAGAWLAGLIFVPLGVYNMMLLPAAILLICMVFPWWVHRRETERAKEPGEVEEKKRPLKPAGGFELIRASRYLMFLAALSMLANWINTTGEYVLDRAILEAAQNQAADQGLSIKEFIGTFRATFFGWVNLAGVVLQLFVVSRILKYLGVRVAIMILPIVAMGGYAAMAAVPLLNVIAIAKITENSVDYSIQNTARQALFLVTSREAKYKAKAVIDTFLVRMGDVLAAATVAVGGVLALSTRQFVMVNFCLAVGLLVLSALVARAHRSRQAEARESAP